MSNQKKFWDGFIHNQITNIKFNWFKTWKESFVATNIVFCLKPKIFPRIFSNLKSSELDVSNLTTKNWVDPPLKKFHNQTDTNAYELIVGLLICTLISDLRNQGLFLTLENFQVL